MERFAGRVAVVTGASSGIGAQIAEDLVRAGMVVVGVARRVDRLQAQAASLPGLRGRLEPLQADLSSTDELRRVFKWVDDNLGGISVLVNNAAILSQVPVPDQDPTDSEKLISTNFTAVLIGCSLGVDSMKKHDIKDGHIININRWGRALWRVCLCLHLKTGVSRPRMLLCSTAGHRILASPGLGSVVAYCATKHATVALTKGLRADLQALKASGFRIRVTSLSPGSVRTEMLPEEYASLITDEDTLLKTKDVSRAALFVLSSPPAVEIVELTIQPTGEFM
ncbi:farnesol dehydrogenase-like [Frankliniella occidentalis]|uniref:Farnesol dehydrogenase-like n=1 Tax=Frankliniella occidentalis TaxID=133901 RepID=A0A9C6X555_FRAOC|nr:farnesol dehydrogenase-like [Frankliniella occidentalis]